MTYLLVPHQADQREATAWIGAIDEAMDPIRLRLSVNGHTLPIPGAWEQWPPAGPPRLTYQRVPLTGLAPQTRYRLELSVAGRPAARAAVATLPERLPAENAERPFSVMLGSCFWVGSDEEGQLTNAFGQLPHAARPTLKILTGDQVYLDAPWPYWAVHTHDRAALARRLFDTYARVWAGRDNAPGLRPILAEGANYFTADDHELWNNAPNLAYYVPDTWRRSGRETWYELAEGLYRAFQSESSTSGFSVGNLSFLVADTRMHRTADRRQFMEPDDLDRVMRWIRGLEGPGVLATGSPLFVKPSNWLWGRAVDWTLANFDQYQRLVSALIAARHSVVIVTGDVHFGRIASCQLPSGAELIEVIASPLSLVDPQASGRWTNEPETFPAQPRHGLQLLVTVDQRYRRSDNHFLTLEFAARGAGVRMRIRSWAAGPAGELRPAATSDRYLH